MLSVTTLISRYKAMRSIRQLRTIPTGCYAFVGYGSHSTQNLYPVLDYLRVPLRYICVTSAAKARLIARARPETQVTTSLLDVLTDSAVKGVLVSATPSAHCSIASQVLASGKSLFVEKPPCQSLAELHHLVELQQRQGMGVSMVGMQKRFSPLTHTLSRRLAGDIPYSYSLHYLTGLYPEGDALLDLFIHPIDLVCHLFGPAQVVCAERVNVGKGAVTLLVTLRHGSVAGVLQLSTAYTWADAREELSINAARGVYHLAQMESLTFTPKRGMCMGIPVEKVFPRATIAEHLYERSNFSPVMANNQVVTQGYYGELKAFVDAVERGVACCKSSFDTLVPTYQLLEQLRATK